MYNFDYQRNPIKYQIKAINMLTELPDVQKPYPRLMIQSAESILSEYPPTLESLLSAYRIMRNARILDLEKTF